MPDIACREVETLRAGRGHRVRRIAREVEPAVLHRLADVAAHGQDALLENPAFLQPESVLAGDARLQLRPDPVLRPVLDLVVRVALEVQPLHLRRAAADQGKTALVTCIDELLAGARRLAEDAEPAERVDAQI